jgi:T5SS/PEP-CTERM-associated repeat protein
LATLWCAATPVEAATKFWDTSNGGNFSTSSNWQFCGIFCNRVPGSDDIAFFGIREPGDFFFTYTVTFSTNVTNDAVAVDDDHMTFDLNSHTYMTGTAEDDVSTIGGSGLSASLTIIDGTWTFDDSVLGLGHIAISPSSNGSGSLVVSTGGAITGLPIIEVGDHGPGTMTVNNGGSVFANQILIANAGGTIGSTMTITGATSTATTSGGIWVGRFATGSLNVTAGGSVEGGVLVDLQGTLRGDGKIFGDLENAGVVAPGNTPGTLDIDGDYTQQDGGITQIEIGGTTAGSQFDTLDITGRATLDGTLDVSLVDGFTPVINNAFEIIHADFGIFGGFDTLSLPPLPDGRAWAIIYTGLGVFLQVQSAVIPGDFNNDGVVDTADYVVWRKTDGAPAGYNLWRTHFGQSTGNGAGGSLSAPARVPEPPMLSLVSFAFVVMLLTGVRPRRSIGIPFLLRRQPGRPRGTLISCRWQPVTLQSGLAKCPMIDCAGLGERTSLVHSTPTTRS